MNSSRRLSLFLPLILLALSCQAVTGIFQAENPTPLPASPTPTLTLTEPPSPTPLPSQTATPSPSPTAPPTETPTVVATPSPLQVQVFEEIWQTVAEEYLYQDFNGLDWDEIHREYLERIEAGLTDEAFYQAMDEMISRLGDEHSYVQDPQEVLEEEAEFAGKNDYVGIGVLISAVPERRRAVIIVVFPGSPAEEAGLKSRDSILAVDGEPILDEEGFLRDIVRGPEGTRIVLTLQTPGQEPRQVTLTRRRISGPLPIPYQVLESRAGQRIGYVLLVSFNDTTVDEQVKEALEAMSAKGRLDGLILDNRQNSGGVDTVLRNTLAYFTQGTLGYFVSRNEERPLQVKGDDVQGSQQVPLVVLIGEGTVSYGEVFAGILKDVGRAYLIGQTTEGNVETLWGYDFEDGSRLWLAHESFRPYNHPEDDWEENGIQPDQSVLAHWDEATLEDDPLVDAALEYFDQD